MYLTFFFSPSGVYIPSALYVDWPINLFHSSKKKWYKQGCDAEKMEMMAGLNYEHQNGNVVSGFLSSTPHAMYTLINLTSIHVSC